MGRQTTTGLRLPSTRHLTASVFDAEAYGRQAGISLATARHAFSGEPINMVRHLAEWASSREDADSDVLEWAATRGRGVWNPDPERYQRDADFLETA